MSADLLRRLRVAPARGPAEREADRAAERTLHSGEPLAPEPLRPAERGGAGGPAPDLVHEALRSPGAPLAPGERAMLAPRPGLDPSEVRVHAGARAAASARALGALAYTVGRDVVFAAGRLAPATPAGRRLLAHELAHVAQQRGTPGVVQRQEAPERAEPHLDYVDDARALREAMDVKPFGTDEERIYEILGAARAAAGGIQALEYAYATEIGSLLEGDLRAELGGGDLELALALLGRTPPAAGPGGSPAAHPAAAARLHAAIHRRFMGPDTRDILAVLVTYQGDVGRIGELKDAYAGLAGAGATLEADLNAELSGEDLRQALGLLHGPREAPAGMPALLLGEAERATAPGTPCSVASVVRYLRAYLDHWYLDGRLLATEQLRAQDPAAPEVAEARAALAQDLDALLGADGAQFLDGGPAVAAPPDAAFWAWLRRVLAHESLFGEVDGRRLNLLWQIAADEDAGQGAPLAILEVTGGTRVELPVGGGADEPPSGALGRGAPPGRRDPDLVDPRCRDHVRVPRRPAVRGHLRALVPLRRVRLRGQRGPAGGRAAHLAARRRQRRPPDDGGRGRRRPGTDG